MINFKITTIRLKMNSSIQSDKIKKYIETIYNINHKLILCFADSGLLLQGYDDICVFEYTITKDLFDTFNYNTINLNIHKSSIPIIFDIFRNHSFIVFNYHNYQLYINDILISCDSNDVKYLNTIYHNISYNICCNSYLKFKLLRNKKKYVIFNNNILDFCDDIKDVDNGSLSLCVAFKHIQRFISTKYNTILYIEKNKPLVISHNDVLNIFVVPAFIEN
jgi:hypothetical protein